MSALRLCLLAALTGLCQVLVQSEDASCEAASKGNSAALLQAAANRTEVEQVVEQGDDIQDDEDELSDSLLERSHSGGAHRVESMDLEDSVVAKGSRRRRSRRRTTTTTTTVDCGDATEYVSISWLTSGGMCLEGVNSGGAQTIDSASCSSINNGRDRFYFEDNGDAYCTLKADFATRRRSAKGKTVTCGTNNQAPAYCKQHGSQSYNKLKLEDLGSNKYSIWWYDSNGNEKMAKRDTFGMMIEDYNSQDTADFKVYKNAIFSSTCVLSKDDLELSCWK